MKRIKVKSTSARKIRNVSASAPRLRSEDVARALGAAPVSESTHFTELPSLGALREDLLRRLGSTGGRPGLEGTARRPKIPLGEVDWARLQELADTLAVEGLRVAPTQVASALLRLSLANLGTAEARLLGRPIQDDRWSQREPPTGKALLALVSRIRTAFRVPEEAEPIPVERSLRWFRDRRPELLTDSEEVPS